VQVARDVLITCTTPPEARDPGEAAPGCRVPPPVDDLDWSRGCCPLELANNLLERPDCRPVPAGETTACTGADGPLLEETGRAFRDVNLGEELLGCAYLSLNPRRRCPAGTVAARGLPSYSTGLSSRGGVTSPRGFPHTNRRPRAGTAAAPSRYRGTGISPSHSRGSKASRSS
jgi:hypothetical protein